MITKDARLYASKYPESIRDDIELAWMAGYNTAKGKAKGELNLYFVDNRYLTALQTWIEYKRERKQPYTQRGIEACYNNLINISNHNPDTAMAIIEQSIANNYSGLFTLKNGKSINSSKNKQSPAERAAGVDELASLAERILQGPSSQEDRGLY